MNTHEHHRKIATSWAAATLSAKGCTLHAVDKGAWDVEMPDGSWQSAEDWRELCTIARETSQ